MSTNDGAWPRARSASMSPKLWPSAGNALVGVVAVEMEVDAGDRERGPARPARHRASPPPARARTGSADGRRSRLGRQAQRDLRRRCPWRAPPRRAGRARLRCRPRPWSATRRTAPAVPRASPPPSSRAGCRACRGPAPAPARARSRDPRPGRGRRASSTNASALLALRAKKIPRSRWQAAAASASSAALRSIGPGRAR